MKFTKLFFAMLFLLVLQVGGAFAQEKPSPDQVKTLLDKAVALVQTSGIDTARETFNKEGEFRFGEIYCTVLDFNGVYLAFPPRPDAVGKSVLNVKDADGHLLVQDMIRVAKDPGEGWIEYRWLNPTTNKIQPKTTLVKRIPGTEWLAFIGLYK